MKKVDMRCLVKNVYLWRLGTSHSVMTKISDRVDNEKISSIPTSKSINMYANVQCFFWRHVIPSWLNINVRYKWRSWQKVHIRSNANGHIQCNNILDGSSLIDDVAYHDEWCRIIVFVIDYCADSSAQLLGVLYIVQSMCFFIHYVCSKNRKVGIAFKNDLHSFWRRCGNSYVAKRGYL